VARVGGDRGKKHLAALMLMFFAPVRVRLGVIALWRMTSGNWLGLGFIASGFYFLETSILDQIAFFCVA